MTAISHCLLYSEDHVRFDEFSRNVFSVLNDILKKSGNLELMIIENDLVANHIALKKINTQEKNLIKRLKMKGITYIKFSPGVTLSELKQLIADISSTGDGIKVFSHIKVGIVDVHMKNVARLSDEMDSRTKNTNILSGFTPEQIAKAEEEYSKISPFKKLHITGFQELVTQFVLMLKKEINILKLLRPVQSHSRHDETHATNVSVLTIFQAQSLGIKKEFHSDIGLAAFLHDVGKRFIPQDILVKESHLKEEEQQIMELHPMYGAQYLSKIDGLTRLAPVVAFEHHLRYDGKGYPQLKAISAKQHICSQMTAISDSFDTLRSTTHDKKYPDIKEVLNIMKINNGGIYNPYLIDNFVRTMNLALSC